MQDFNEDTYQIGFLLAGDCVLKNARELVFLVFLVLKTLTTFCYRLILSDQSSRSA